MAKTHDEILHNMITGSLESYIDNNGRITRKQAKVAAKNVESQILAYFTEMNKKNIAKEHGDDFVVLTKTSFEAIQESQKKLRQNIINLVEKLKVYEK